MNSSIKISTQYDSKEDQLINQIREENSLYVIIGSNNGSLFNKLKNLPPIDGTRYVVIEPNKIYLDLLNNSPLENSERVYFGNASNWKQILIHLKADNYLYSNQLFLKKYQSNDPEVQQKYNDLNIDVENTILTYAKGLLIQANRIPYIKNILVNLPDLILPAKILEGKGKGTALVVGAGPSLDDHLHWIKEHKNKLTIICISRVYAQLKKEDIDPDIIVSVDPQDVNYEQSKSILLEEKSILVHSNYVAPKLLAQWKGPKLYLENLFPWEHKKNIPNLQVGSPTVAHSAISLAIDMQFDQILLVGVDLCYWHESKTHSGNINLDKNAQDHDFNEVKTYSGESAKTSFFMKLGIKSLEQLASSFHKKILNLSNKAAIVNGIEHTNQPELDDETFNLFESLEIQETDAQKHLQLIKIETTKCVQNINQIKELCQKALKLNSVNSTTQNPDTIEKNLVRIDRIEKKLEKKYKIYSDFIKTAVAEDLLKLLRQSDTNNHNHAIKNKWLKDYYNYFFEGTSITLDFLENARIVIESRFLEYESKVNEEALKKSWDKLGIPGRSCIYSANSFHNLVENNINDLCIEHKKMLNPASQIVKKSSEALNTFHETYISFIVHKKLEKISQSNEEYEIQRLKILKNDFISLTSPLKSYKPYELLINGILLELENKPTEAVETYIECSKIIELSNISIDTYIHSNLISFLLIRLINLSLINGLRAGLKLLDLSTDRTINIYNTRTVSLKTEIFRRFHSIFQNLGFTNIFPFIKKAFSAKKTEVLTELASLIEKSFSSDYINLRTLIQGMVLQLENETERARNCYSTILDNSDISKLGSKILITETLNQILTTTNDTDEIKQIHYLLKDISEST